MIISSPGVFHSHSLILVADKPPRISDEKFQEILSEAATLLVEYIGLLHGPSALQIFGKRIAECEVITERCEKGFVGLKLRANGPERMSRKQFEDAVGDFWFRIAVSSGEVYRI